MSQLNILHVSDVHLDGSTPNRIVTDFLADVTDVASATPIDAVIFTGDLVARGSEASLFSDAKSRFLDPLLEAVGCSIEHLVLVPGNHDLDRDANPLWVEQKLIDDVFNSSNDVENWFADPVNFPHFQRKFENFVEFISTNYPHHHQVGDLGYVVEIEVAGTSVGVAVANSAWRSRGRGDNDDRNHLLVGRPQLTALLESVKSSAVSILAIHHPAEWLKEFDQRSLKSRLSSFDFVACGHTHDANGIATTDRSGSSIICQGGALYQGEEFRNSYSILSVDLEARQITTTVRRWYPERHCFDIDPSVGPDERLTLPLRGIENSNSSVGERQHGNASTNVDLATVLHSQAASELHLIQSDLASDEDPYEGLIEPPTYPVRYSEVRDADRSGTRVSPLLLGELVGANAADIAIVGAANSGRTCALHWSLHTANRARSAAPILIDASTLTTSSNSLAFAVRKHLRSVGVRVDSELTNAPPLVIGIDNIDLLKHQDHLARLRELRPDDQLIVSVKDDGFTPTIPGWPLPGFVEAHLAPYGTQQLRQLAAQMYPQMEDEWTTMVRSSANLLLSQGLDGSPWTAVVVLLLYRYEPELRRADPTGLIDKYIDLVLGKWQTAIDASVASDVDHITRRDYLMHLAAHRTRETSNDLNIEAATQFTEAYFESRSQIVDSASFVDDLIRRRVLGGTADRVDFTPSSLFAFFQALAVQKGHLTEEELLQGPLPAFEAAIHLAGLTRDRRELLIKLSGQLDLVMEALPATDRSLFETLDRDAWGDEPAVDETLSALERLGHTAGISQNDDFKDFITDGLLNEREGGAGSDVVEHGTTDSSEPGPVTESLQESGLVDQIAGIRRLVDAVGLLSLCLQRSELVPDPDLKRTLIAKAIAGWSKVFVALCATDVRTPDEDRRARNALREEFGITAKQEQAQVEFGTFLEVSGAALGYLSAPRLTQSFCELAEHDVIDHDDLVARLITALLLVANTDEVWVSYIRGIREDFPGAAHVSTLVHRMLGFRYFDLDAPEAVVQRLEDQICEAATAGLRGPAQRASQDSIRQSLRTSRARMAAMAKRPLAITPAPGSAARAGDN